MNIEAEADSPPLFLYRKEDNVTLTNIYSLNVDIKKRMTSIVPTFSQGDSAVLKFRVYDNGKLMDMSDYTHSEVMFRQPSGRTLTGDADLVNGEIVYTFTGLEMAEIGKLETILSVSSGSSTVSIQPFYCFIFDNMRSNNLEYIGILQELIKEVQGLELGVGGLLNDFNSFDYSPSTTYDFPNLITYDGSTYIALKAVTGITPIDDKINYRVVAKRGDDSEEISNHKNNTSPQKHINVVSSIPNDISNMGILVKVDGTQADIPSMITVDEINKNITQKIQTANLAFKESYATLTALQAAYPTGDINNHVVLSDGMIYTWANNSWVNTQIQANGTGIIDGTVTPTKFSGYKVGKNLYNKKTSVDGRNLDSSNGIPVTNVNRTTSDFIEVEPSLPYVVSGDNSGNKRVAFYNSNKQFISLTTSSRFISPINTAFIRVSLNLTDKDTYQIEQSEDATAYVPYSFLVDELSIENIESKIEDDSLDGIKIKNSSVPISKLEGVVFSKNLFNSETAILDRSIARDSGFENSSSGNFASPFIKAEELKHYYLSTTKSSTHYRIIFYDSTKSMLTSFADVPTALAPEGTRFLRFAMSQSALPDVQLEQSQARTSYEKYSFEIKHLIHPESDKGNGGVVNTVNITNDLKALPKPSPIEATYQYSAASAPSYITNPQYYQFVFNYTTLNPIFTYHKNVKVAGTTEPDRNAINSSRGGYTVSFKIYGDSFELRTKGVLGGLVNILVDGEYLFENPIPLTPNSGEGLGSSHRLLVELHEEKFYDIELRFSGTSKIFGISLKPNATLFPLNSNKPLAVWLGDSQFEGGSSGDAMTYSMIATASKMLDWEVWNFGVGGTGFVNGEATNTNYISRLNSVIDIQPDFLVVNASGNDEKDSPSLSTVETKMREFVSQAVFGLPNTKIILTGAINPSGTIIQARLDYTNLLKQIALDYELPFIDIINGSTYDKNGVPLISGLGNFITGTGNAGSPQTSGNASKFVSSDGFHMTRAGHIYFGQRLATEIHRILVAE